MSTESIRATTKRTGTVPESLMAPGSSVRVRPTTQWTTVNAHSSSCEWRAHWVHWETPEKAANIRMHRQQKTRHSTGGWLQLNLREATRALPQNHMYKQGLPQQLHTSSHDSSHEAPRWMDPDIQEEGCRRQAYLFTDMVAQKEDTVHATLSGTERHQTWRMKADHDEESPECSLHHRPLEMQPKLRPSKVAKCQPSAMLSGRDTPPQGQYSLICQKSTKHQPGSDQRMLQSGDSKAQAKWEHEDSCILRRPQGKATRKERADSVLFTQPQQHERNGRPLSC